MLMSELLPIIGGVREFIDATPESADLPRHLRLPHELRHVRCTLAEAEKLELTPGSLLVTLLGAEPPEHAGPEDVAPALRRMRPGAQALLLTAWPTAELPHRRLLEALVDSCCRLQAAVPMDEPSRHGVHCALVVERVDAPAALDTDPADLPSADGGPDAQPSADLRAELRSANERLLGELDAGRRVAEADRHAAERVRKPTRHDRILAERAARIAELERLAADQQVRLRASARELASLRQRLATLESSTTVKAGRVLVEGARHPAKAVVSVPVGLARLWRAKRSRTAAGPPARSGPPATRVVPIALPSASPNRGRTAPALLTMSAPRELLVPRRLAGSGLVGYEPSAMACFLAVLDVAGPGAVLDIGANVSIYGGLASALTSRPTWAFEPSPHLVEVARRFAADNGLAYTTEALALGAENRSATFYLSDSSDTSNSLAAGFRESSVQVEVPVETLDSFVARTGAVPAIMKVDTETTEPDVLSGAAATIIEHRPWILCEVLAGRVETRLTEILGPFGYHWFQITSDVPYRERDRIEGDPSYQDLMWLFTPEVPDERFWAAVRARAAELAGCTVQRARELHAQERPTSA
jgi:FkbM family methyltransferase